MAASLLPTPCVRSHSPCAFIKVLCGCEQLTGVFKQSIAVKNAFNHSFFAFIIRLEARTAEYWIHFTARFGGVHAFGYNCAESEPIWMKSGAL